MSYYKLIGLSIANIRKIRCAELEIAPSGITQIRGKNEQGKTTVLKSIEMLLGGKGAIPSDVVTHGEESGSIIGKVVNSDNGQTFIVEKVIKDGDQKLKVSTDNGMQVAKPQSFLDTLINETTINPRPFMLKSAKDKITHLMKFLKIDTSKEDASIKEMEENRTLVGREVKKLGTPVHKDTTEAVDVTALNKEKVEINAKMAPKMQEAYTKYSDDKETYDAAVKRHGQLNDSIAAKMISIANAEAEITRLRGEIDTHKNNIQAITEELFTVVVPDEPEKPTADTLFTTENARIAEIDKDIEAAAVVNEKAKQYQEYKVLLDTISAKNREYDGLTASIKEKRVAKLKKLNDVKMPIPGLEIVVDQEDRPDGVYFNSTHCDNWSESEALRISLAIAAAAMPGLRAIFLDGANSFDAGNLAVIDEWAKANDIQIILTIVADNNDVHGDNVFFIEEGQVM